MCILLIILLCTNMLIDISVHSKIITTHTVVHTLGNAAINYKKTTLTNNCINSNRKKWISGRCRRWKLLQVFIFNRSDCFGFDLLEKKIILFYLSNFSKNVKIYQQHINFCDSILKCLYLALYHFRQLMYGKVNILYQTQKKESDFLKTIFTNRFS